MTVGKKVHRTTFAVGSLQWPKGCRERPVLPGFYGTKSKYSQSSRRRQSSRVYLYCLRSVKVVFAIIWRSTDDTLDWIESSIPIVDL